MKKITLQELSYADLTELYKVLEYRRDAPWSTADSKSTIISKQGAIGNELEKRLEAIDFKSNG